MPDVPHFALPFRVTGDRVVVREQDTPEEIQDCVEVALRTELGSKVEMPEFGVPDVALMRDLPLDEVAESLRRSEPRVDVLLEESRDRFNSLVRRVAVEGKVATNG